VSIPSQPCFPHLLCNVYHLTSSSLHSIMSLTSSPSSLLNYVSIPSQPCFPHLLCNVYHTTSSDLFISECFWPAILHLFLLRVHTISTLLPSPSLQCLPPQIFFWSLHSIISMNLPQVISTSRGWT
jgi:hypothetical protein